MTLTGVLVLALASLAGASPVCTDLAVGSCNASYTWSNSTWGNVQVGVNVAWNPVTLKQTWTYTLQNISYDPAPDPNQNGNFGSDDTSNTPDHSKATYPSNDGTVGGNNGVSGFDIAFDSVNPGFADVGNITQQVPAGHDVWASDVNNRIPYTTVGGFGVEFDLGPPGDPDSFGNFDNTTGTGILPGDPIYAYTFTTDSRYIRFQSGTNPNTDSHVHTWRETASCLFGPGSCSFSPVIDDAMNGQIFVPGDLTAPLVPPTPGTVPEPATLALVGTGLLGLWRKRR